MKDPDRVPDASTLRRWSVGVDRSQPAASFRNETLARVARWLRRDAPADFQAEPLPSLTPIREILWPLRL